MARKSKKANGFEHIVLSWKPRPYDHRDWQLSNFITPEMRLKASGGNAYDWEDNKILDQGSSPECVGYAWAGYGICTPIVDAWDNSWGHKIYQAAKVIDGDNQDGSTTLSGVKAFMGVAKLEGDGYAWAHTLDDIVTWVLLKSPIIVGSDWDYNMFYPDADGLVHIGGGIAGGHEWMIYGVDTVSREFHCVNSWGDGFGVNGKFKIGFDDFDILWSDGGDAVTAVEASSEPVPVPVPVPTPVPSNIPEWLRNLLIAFAKWILSLFGL